MSFRFVGRNLDLPVSKIENLVNKIGNLVNKIANLVILVLDDFVQSCIGFGRLCVVLCRFWMALRSLVSVLDGFA